jgi:hypothetical protein
VATTRPSESRAKKEDKFKDNRPNFRAGGDYYRNKDNFKTYDDMDDDNPKNGIRMSKPKDQVKTKLPPDQQPDKYEVMKRIEREKKALQKKLTDEARDRHEHLMKYKKTAKTNWTKHYENGMLNEDDFGE